MRRMARMTSTGVAALASRPSRLRASVLSGMDFALRGHTPPPREMSLRV